MVVRAYSKGKDNNHISKKVNSCKQGERLKIGDQKKHMAEGKVLKPDTQSEENGRTNELGKNHDY